MNSSGIKRNRFSMMFGKNGMDERQMYLSGRMYKHIAVYMGFLLVVNALLSDAGVYWADGFTTNMLILYASVVAGFIEKIFQGIIDFDKPAARGMIVFCLVGPLTVGFALWPWSNVPKMIEDGMLSRAGGALVMGLILCVAGICLLWQWRRERRHAVN